MTSHAFNLSQSIPYTGSKNVMLGNGSKIPITNVGVGFLHTSNSDYLALNDMLHTPHVAANLISVN